MADPRDLSPPSILLLDVETSGLYREDLTPFDAGQPWCPQISFALCNESGLIVHHASFIIKADGRTTKENALKVHGVSAWAASQVGVPEPRMLGLLADALKTAPVRGMKVVTYGDMDRRVISSLFSRFGESQGKPNGFDRLWAARPGIEFIDMMVPWCQQACKLPSEIEAGDYRWPSMDLAAEMILGRQPREGLHDAWEDVLILKDLFFHFFRAGAFERVAA